MCHLTGCMRVLKLRKVKQDFQGADKHIVTSNVRTLDVKEKKCSVIGRVHQFLIYNFMKRAFDILASGTALVALAPVWAVAIIGIEVSDPGPAFYLADRIGKDNRHFCMYKFRSMRVAKGADEKSLRPDQDRIFPWGDIMRRTKMDELPQLMNVLVGNMSIIGPRPASADQVAIVRAGRYAAVSCVKPGLSSPSALYDYIYGDSITDEGEYIKRVLPTRLRLDLYYLQARSLVFDAKMVWWTVLAILATGSRIKILRALVAAAKTVGEGKDGQKTAGSRNDAERQVFHSKKH